MAGPEIPKESPATDPLAQRDDISEAGDDSPAW